MTPQNNVAPTTLYDGFHKDVWQGAGNNIPYSSATLPSRIADVLPVVRQAGEVRQQLLGKDGCQVILWPLTCLSKCLRELASQFKKKL